MGSNVTVTQDPEKPVEPEVLATAIVKISEGMNRLCKSGLNEEAIVVLLYDYTSGIAKRDIKAVLNGLRNLATKYTKKV